MASDMVERVGWALAATGMVAEGSGTHELFTLARAAIEAMREPTEAMVTKAYHCQTSDDLNIDRDDLVAYWQYMVDAALKD